MDMVIKLSLRGDKYSMFSIEKIAFTEFMPNSVKVIFSIGSCKFKFELAFSITYEMPTYEKKFRRNNF